MAKGNEILLSADPGGKFEDIIISGTPKPGQILELKTATAAQGGRFTYQVSSRTAGAKGPNPVLLNDKLQGRLSTTAYADGERARIYWPQAGDELNCLLGDVAGTGDAVAIGDKFGVDNAGKIKANASYTSTPFQALEVIAAGGITADALVFVKYLGDQA